LDRGLQNETGIASAELAEAARWWELEGSGDYHGQKEHY